MIYKDFKGTPISALGFGTVRFPVIDGDDARIDMTQAQALVDQAIAAGINYFDTGYQYHGMTAEKAMGTLLQKYPRESYLLGAKFPGYVPAYLPKVEEIFEEQLTNLQTDYVDFYMIHNVSESSINGYLDPANRVLSYLKAQKEAGRIRHLGFSAHGSAATIRRFLEATDGLMEFALLQINYLDWFLQGAKDKVAVMNEFHLPVWVMEPLRGGRLTNLPEEAAAQLKACNPDVSLASWSFRFLQGIPGIQVVLSGMTYPHILAENAATFSQENPLTPNEQETLSHVIAHLLQDKTLPCTGCRYCVPYCPQKLDIPTLLQHYNNLSYGGSSFVSKGAIAALLEEAKPSACIGCGSCEAVCPQQLGIAKAMATCTELLNPKGA